MGSRSRFESEYGDDIRKVTRARVPHFETLRLEFASCAAAFLARVLFEFSFRWRYSNQMVNIERL